MSFQKVPVSELPLNPFTQIGKDWMLVTASDGTRVNAMTASWGGLGVLWGAEVAYVVIRPQRYTRELIDRADGFTLSFFDGGYKKELGVLGTLSGRDGDKLAQVGFTVRAFDGVPAPEQASLVIVTRKLYRQPLRGECFIEPGLDAQHYPHKDYHILYIARIQSAYQRV